MMALILFCFSCTADKDTASCESTLTYENWAQSFFRSKCQSCHASSSPERFGAPESIVFDSLEDVLSEHEAIHSSVLDRNSMPPGGGLTDEEREGLYQWLDCPQ